MMSPTVIRGSSDANGSWKIICIFRRTRRSAAAAQLRDVLPVEQ